MHHKHGLCVAQHVQLRAHASVAVDTIAKHPHLLLQRFLVDLGLLELDSEHLESALLFDLVNRFQSLQHDKVIFLF